MHYKITIFFIGLILLMACQTEVQQTIERNQYFDIQSFIEQEIEKLSKEEFSLIKLMHHSASTDTMFIEKPDWKKELQIFASANVNKPVLYDTYQVDTTNNEIVYKSLKPGNLVKQLHLTYNTIDLKMLKSVKVECRNQNFLSATQQMLTYESGKRYTIDIHQDVIGSDENNIVIEGLIDKQKD